MSRLHSALSSPVNRWLEPLLAIAIATGFGYALVYLLLNGFLPQPFFYDQYDTWMDWFNVSWWGYNGSMYDYWASIYPPISFAFTNLFSDPSCYRASSPDARACDIVGIATLHLLYVLDVVLASRILYRFDRRTALPRAVALALSLPLTGGLERGNLVLPAFAAFMLAFGPLLRSARLRWLAAGIAINFKVYLIAAVFPQLVRRRWRWFEGAVIATIAVYLVTYLMVGDGSPIKIYDNIVYFSGLRDDGTTLLDAWFAATYQPLMSAVNTMNPSLAVIMGTRWEQAGVFAMTAFTRTAQVSILLSFVAAWLRPEAVPMHRLTNLGLCLALISAESGFYSLVFIIFATFLERWEGFGCKYAIVLAYIICMPFDIPVMDIPPTMRDIFFGNTTIEVQYSVMLGPFIRPALTMTIPVALACVTIRQVWIDIRTQGWRTRWRFRHDAPVMVGVGEAMPPPNAPPAVRSA